MHPITVYSLNLLVCDQTILAADCPTILSFYLCLQLLIEFLRRIASCSGIKMFRRFPQFGNLAVALQPLAGYMLY